MGVTDFFERRTALRRTAGIRQAPPEEYAKYRYPDYPAKSLPALVKHFRKTEPEYYDTLKNHIAEHGITEPAMVRFTDPRGRPLKQPEMDAGHHRAAVAYELGLHLPVGDRDDPEDFEATRAPARAWFTEHGEEKARNAPSWRHGAHTAARTPFEFREETVDTGGTKYPRHTTLTAHHPETGEKAGELRYYPPKRKGGLITVDSMSSSHPGATSALFDEMEARHPGSRVTHIDDKQKGGKEHNSPLYGTPTDWASVHPELPEQVHRGMSITPEWGGQSITQGRGTAAEHARMLRAHIEGKPAGMHWSSDEQVSKVFSHRNIRDPRTDVPVVLHADRPDEKDIEKRPQVLKNNGVWQHGYEFGDAEVPIRRGRPVTIRGISWKPDAEHPEADAEGWVHHTFDEPIRHTAGRGDGRAICACCGGSGEHDTGRECYRCDSSGYVEGDEVNEPIPCAGTVPAGAVIASTADDPHFRPSSRIFGPTYGLDHRLFDGRHLRPEVRQAVLRRLDSVLRPLLGPDWQNFVEVYLAGSEASEWTGPNLEGNNDFDTLLGVNYDAARHRAPGLAGNEDNADIDAWLNKALHAEYNAEPWHTPFGDYSLTGYCNPNAYDIRAIKPYAAYDISDDRWAVEPPHLPSWSLESFPEGHALVEEGEAVSAYVRAILEMPEPYRTQQGAALYDFLHSDRSRAFGPNGEGWYDPGNVLEKWLDQEGLWAQLVRLKHNANQGTYDEGYEPEEWSNTPHMAGAHGDLPEGITFEHKTPMRGLHTLYARHPDAPENKDYGPHLGRMAWWGNGEIANVAVHPDYQRRGLASELFRRAKQITPDLHHSDILTDEGDAWAKKTASSDSDRWVQCDQGHTHWGASGAAGMLIRHTDDKGTKWYLLQKRAPWVDHGDTWGIPGGALDTSEADDPAEGARRETEEEMGELPHDVKHSHTVTDDHGWTVKAGHEGIDPACPMHGCSSRKASGSLRGTPASGAMMQGEPPLPFRSSYAGFRPRQYDRTEETPSDLHHSTHTGRHSAEDTGLDPSRSDHDATGEPDLHSLRAMSSPSGPGTSCTPRLGTRKSSRSSGPDEGGSHLREDADRMNGTSRRTVDGGERAYPHASSLDTQRYQAQGTQYSEPFDTDASFRLRVSSSTSRSSLPEEAPYSGCTCDPSSHTNRRWKYHTVIADSPHMFTPEEDDDDESRGHGWFTAEEMKDLPLHPGFAKTWDKVRRSRTDKVAFQRLAEGDYRMQHRAPGADEIPIHDLVNEGGELGVPEDVYTHPHYYSNMNDPGMREAHRVLNQVRGKPDAPVKIYRALPAEHAHEGFHPGDWVTTSKDYARQHGKHPTDPKHDWPVISATVPAKHLHTAADDFREYGYNGPDQPKASIAYSGGEHQKAVLNACTAATRDIDLSQVKADAEGSWMVAIVPPKHVAEALAQEDGEPPEQLHITLLYLGKTGRDLTEKQAEKLPELIRQWAKTQPVLHARTQGAGTFVNDGEHPLWASVNIPRGTWAHNSLVDFLTGHGYKIAHSYGWIPHITLDYSKWHVRFLPKIEPMEWDITEIWLCHGDHWQSYPLKKEG